MRSPFRAALAYLSDRAIDAERAIEMSGARIADCELAVSMGFPFARRSQGGIVWPYIDPLTHEPHPTLMRIRYLGKLPCNDSGEEIKCVQPFGSGVEAFFDADINWLEVLRDPSIPIAITEGEAKTICMNQHRGKGYNTATVGLGGVWSFRDKESGDLTPWLRMVRAASQDREMIICFDSDMAQKEDIQRAAAKFAELMQIRVQGVQCI